MRQVHTLEKVYTAQRNSNANIIVCRGEEARKSYIVIFTGSYDDCYSIKLGIKSADTAVLTIVAVQSKVTWHWGYCPEPAVSLLRLDLDDKPSGYLTAEAALAAARRDRTIPKGARFVVQS